MNMKKYFALSALAAALALSGCASTPKSAPSAEAGNAGEEVDLVAQLRERMKQGKLTRQDRPEEQAVAAGSDSSQSPQVTVDMAKQQAAMAVAPEYARAMGMMAAGKDAEAEKLLARIAEKAPHFSGPLVNMAVLQLKQQHYAEAQALLQKAIAINAKNPYAYNLLGVSLREQGKFADARAAYETALSLDPNYAKAHFNLGVLADLYMQDLPLALTHYERYQGLQNKSDTGVGNWIVDLQKRTGTYQAAAPKAAPPASTDAPAAEPAPADAPADAAATPAPASVEGGQS